MTIDEWIANEKTYKTVNNLVKEKIGIDNELLSARHTDENGEIVAAVRYNGFIYDAFYNRSGVQENFNTNPHIMTSRLIYQKHKSKPTNKNSFCQKAIMSLAYKIE